MALRKPSDFFGKVSEETNLPIVDSDDTLREELSKVESLSEQVIQLQQELSQKVVRNDLESLVLSQINNMQENFQYLQKDFKQSNKKDISEFKEKVSELTNIVGNLVENELPKYKKQITNNELRIGGKFDELKENVEENIAEIKEEVDTKIKNIAFVVDENLDYFNQHLQETSSEVKNTINTYNQLSKIVESRISKENEQLEEYSQVIKSLYEAFVELENSVQEESSTHLQMIEDKFQTISSDVNDKIDDINEEIDNFKDEISSEVSNIKADVVIFEKHSKDTEKTIQEFSEQLSKISEINEGIFQVNESIDNLQDQYDEVFNQSIETRKNLEVVERYIQNHHQELFDLKEEVFTEIEQLPVGNIQENLERLEKKIDYIKETYSKIEPEVLVKEVIREGLLNEPPETKNDDPLTPLDQNFVTLDQLQGHYRLFINRIQQQLATLGGGGETKLRFLDDVVGIATNPGAYDGKYLQWNATTNTAEFVTVTGIGSTGGGSGVTYIDAGPNIIVSDHVGIVTVTGIGLTIGSTPPANPVIYPLWYDSVLGRGFVYYNDGNSSQWVDFCPSGINQPTSIISITGFTTYYAATLTDDYIGVNANVPVTIDLPTSPTVGKKIIVKDEGNKISTYNITVRAGAGASVENDTSVVMKINHQSFTYFYNGSNWFII